jgi:hypothetical protein
MQKRVIFVIGFTLLSVLAALLLPAMPQPLDYHDFADHRHGFGIANVLDTTSNVGFLVAGAAGLFVLMRRRTCFEHPGERWPYALFFIGLLLTAAGSAYYHLAPDNERLFWDRLPMTIAFMSLIAAQIVDRISIRAGLLLLVPMIGVGMASAIYWIATERAGAGNVVPYGVLQVYAVVMLLAIAWLHPSRYTRGSDIYWVFAAYVAAKILETFDRDILAFGNLVSGHTLKHLAAAVGGLVVCRMLWLRDTAAAETTMRATVR